MKRDTGDSGWVLMDALAALLLGAALLAALGPLLARTAEAALRLGQRSERLIELRNSTGVPTGEADEQR